MNALTKNKWNIVAVAFLVAVAVVRLPVPTGQYRIFMRLLFEIGGALIVAGFVADRVNGWIGALIALVVVSWVYAMFRHHTPTVQRVAYLTKNAVVYGGVSLILFSMVDKKWLENAMIFIAIANLVFIAMQAFEIDPFRIFTLGLMKLEASHPIGLMGNKNETSALFAICAWAFIRPKLWPLVILPISGLIFAKSTGGIVAFATGMLFVWLASGRPFPKINARPWIKSAAVIAGMAAIVQIYIEYFDADLMLAFTERFKIWSLGNEGIDLNPVTGIGAGLWPLATNQMHAHNEYLQAWFETGYLSLIFFAGYAVSVFARYEKRAMIPTAALITIAVNCAVSFTMHIPPTALLILAWIAILETTLKEKPKCQTTIM